LSSRERIEGAARSSRTQVAFLENCLSFSQQDELAEDLQSFSPATSLLPSWFFFFFSIAWLLVVVLYCCDGKICYDKTSYVFLLVANQLDEQVEVVDFCEYNEWIEIEFE
jgi:hypothetical protein